MVWLQDLSIALDEMYGFGMQLEKDNCFGLVCRHLLWLQQFPFSFTTTLGKIRPPPLKFSNNPSITIWGPDFDCDLWIIWIDLEMMENVFWLMGPIRTTFLLRRDHFPTFSNPTFARTFVFLLTLFMSLQIFWLILLWFDIPYDLLECSHTLVLVSDTFHILFMFYPLGVA